jgi:hypothetical protein
MSSIIDDYIREEGNQIIFDKRIIGKKIISDYKDGEARVLEVGYDSNGPYIIVKGKENHYKISSEIFNFFEIID